MPVPSNGKVTKKRRKGAMRSTGEIPSPWRISASTFPIRTPMTDANGWGLFQEAHQLWDWTDGCIAVTNAEMRDIWARVPNHTPIDIIP